MTSAQQSPVIGAIRDASRRLVRELGFLQGTLAGTDLPPSAVHAIVEIGSRGEMTAADLCEVLGLEKSSVSRMLRKLVDTGELVETVSGQDGRVKPLSLSARGRATLAAIDAFAATQVGAALDRLEPGRQRTVLDGLASYAGALAASRTGRPAEDRDVTGTIVIGSGYRPGIIGRTAEMHARYYQRTAGFGRVFESGVAAGLAGFTDRLPDEPNSGPNRGRRNGLWYACRAGEIVGTVAIDGEDLGPDIAHLRWFIVDDGLRGSGIGRRLLGEALGFCDRNGFGETHLWTFRGLDAARRLYEAHGFVLAEERPGCRWGGEVMEQRFVRKGTASPNPRPISWNASKPAAVDGTEA